MIARIFANEEEIQTNRWYSWAENPAITWKDTYRQLARYGGLLRTDVKYLISPEFSSLRKLHLYIPCNSIEFLFHMARKVPPEHRYQIIAWQEVNEGMMHSDLDSDFFCGYDVLDGDHLLGGLTQHKYEPEEEYEMFKAKYGHRINQYSLLDDLEVAREFCRETDLRVPEHAPFFVVAVYYYGPQWCRNNLRRYRRQLKARRGMPKARWF